MAASARRRAARLTVAIGGTQLPAGARGAAPRLPRMNVATWNVAGVNNNPFEFWIRGAAGGADGFDGAAYQELMEGVEQYVTAPPQLRVDEVFTPAMFDDLARAMEATAAAGAEGWTQEGIDWTRAQWEGDYGARDAIPGFLRASVVGKKRLVSMPDRVSNTVDAFQGGDRVTLYRPSAMNCYAGDLRDVATWWGQWRDFMFVDKLSFKPGAAAATVASRLVPISRKKYPAVTEEEAAASLPLQTLCLALFDALTVHMLYTVARDTWQPLRAGIAAGIGAGKQRRTLDVLSTPRYAAHDVVFLQETPASLADAAAAHPGLGAFQVARLDDPDTRRPQNSVMLLARARFPTTAGPGAPRDVTAEVVALAGGDIGLAKGDLLAVRATEASGRELLLASMHADTTGLATLPCLRALAAYAAAHGIAQLYGMDANAHWSGGLPERLSVAEFDAELPTMGLTSTWLVEGTGLRDRLTTFNARTPLQPQANKAVRHEDVDVAAGWAGAASGRAAAGGERPVNPLVDMHPKDAIMFAASDWASTTTRRDNTGDPSGTFVATSTLPTPSFPSDHSIVSATLSPPDLDGGDRSEL